MTYSNPRLKHVKKIKEMCEDYKFPNCKFIIDQCNLLLETKKVCKCKKISEVETYWGDCPIHNHELGLKKETKKKEPFYFFEFKAGDKEMNRVDLETKKAKKRKCLHNDIKLVFERGSGGYLGEFCNTCKKYRPDPKEEMGEIEFLECEVCSKNPGSPVLCNGCLNDRAVIDRVNILSKSK